jgi:hypothetical protein
LNRRKANLRRAARVKASPCTNVARNVEAVGDLHGGRPHRRRFGREHFATVEEKIAWVDRRRSLLRRRGTRDIIEMMRVQGYFSPKSYWYDCQGLLCELLGRDREPQ